MQPFGRDIPPFVFHMVGSVALAVYGPSPGRFCIYLNAPGKAHLRSDHVLGGPTVSVSAGGDFVGMLSQRCYHSGEGGGFQSAA